MVNSVALNSLECDRRVLIQITCLNLLFIDYFAPVDMNILKGVLTQCAAEAWKGEVLDPAMPRMTAT